MTCCKNDLGSFPHNKEINTEIVAAQSGMHELMFTGPLGVKFTRYLNFGSGDPIVFPANTLNEDFQYLLVITQPDGTIMESDDCPNFSLKTFINKIACDDIQYL